MLVLHQESRPIHETGKVEDGKGKAIYVRAAAILNLMCAIFELVRQVFMVNYELSIYKNIILGQVSEQFNEKPRIKWLDLLFF